jgi:hypothetical protein
MAGVASELDLVKRVVDGRHVAPQSREEMERVASKLFSKFFKINRYLPSQPSQEEFMAGFKRRTRIENRDHFLLAVTQRYGEKVRVLIKLNPLHGNSLEAATGFSVSFPGSAVEETYNIREKAVWTSPGKKELEEIDKAMMNLLTDLNNPATRIRYFSRERNSGKPSSF